jgi:transposase
VLSLYNQKGPEAIPDGRHKNPGQKPLLSPELQEELRQALPHPRDGLWTGRSVAEWLCVPYNTAWEWLKRLGFSPLRPRPRHREADPKAQEEFKKNSWVKTSQRPEVRLVHLLLSAEGEFGLAKLGDALANQA